MHSCVRVCVCVCVCTHGSWKYYHICRFEFITRKKLPVLVLNSYTLPRPWLLGTTRLVSIPTILSFREYHINGIPVCTLWDWLFSPNIVSLRWPRLLSGSVVCSFSLPSGVHGMDVPPGAGRLGLLQVWARTDQAVRNVCIQVLVWTFVFISLG